MSLQIRALELPSTQAQITRSTLESYELITENWTPINKIPPCSKAQFLANTLVIMADHRRLSQYLSTFPSELT
jgi:hypothetical protein